MIAKINELDLEVVNTEPYKGVDAEYLKINKLGKIPSFVGSDGFVLTECIAIAVYREYLSQIFSSPPENCYKRPS